MVACLGAYVARKQDGEPGAESFGTGLRRLIDITFGWRLRRKHRDQSYEQTDAKFV
jgi:hypothetical protein